MSKGIDYGRGQTNIDTQNGIRFGVISSNEVCQAWGDSSEPHYPCDDCDCEQGDDNCSNAECDPSSWYIDNAEYAAEQTRDDSDIFITRSPYYTRAQFCSPCAPGAGYLMSPDDDGEKTYCFGHDWFYDTDDNRAPYPVYRVADDGLINTL